MSIKPVLVPDHTADDLRRLMDHFAEASTGPVKSQLNEMDYGGGRSPHAGMGLPHDDDDDDAGKKEIIVKPEAAKKTFKDVGDILDREFSRAHDDKGVAEGVSNADEDPNLAKAYRLGNEAYKALKNHPARAQAAQDKIEAEFPQYAKMWLSGYRDGERFDQEKTIEEQEVAAFKPGDRVMYAGKFATVVAQDGDAYGIRVDAHPGTMMVPASQLKKPSYDESVTESIDPVEQLRADIQRFLR